MLLEQVAQSPVQRQVLLRHHSHLPAPQQRQWLGWHSAAQVLHAPQAPQVHVSALQVRLRVIMSLHSPHGAVSRSTAPGSHTGVSQG